MPTERPYPARERVFASAGNPYTGRSTNDPCGPARENPESGGPERPDEMSKMANPKGPISHFIVLIGANLWPPRTGV